VKSSNLKVREVNIYVVIVKQNMFVLNLKGAENFILMHE
jgi:hypothetical protein